MSKYGWESGTIKLPSRAWAGFKKALRETHNKQRDDVLTDHAASLRHLLSLRKSQQAVLKRESRLKQTMAGA